MQLGAGPGPLQWLTLLSVTQWGQEAPHPAVNFHLGQRRGAANPEVCFYFSPTFQSRSQSRGVVYIRTLNKVKQNKIPLLAFILNCVGQMASYREREKEGILTLGFLSCWRAVIIANDPQLYTLPLPTSTLCHPHLPLAFLFKLFSSQPCKREVGGSFMMDQPSSHPESRFSWNLNTAAGSVPKLRAVQNRANLQFPIFLNVPTNVCELIKEKQFRHCP